MVRVWANSATYSHGAAAAPVAAYLIWRLARVQGPSAGEPSAPALAALAVLAGLWAAGRAVGAEIVHQAAFIAVFAAGLAAMFGFRAIRPFAFPLAFLFFAVPAGASLQPLLQSATTSVVTAMLEVSGHAVTRDGATLTLSWGAFRIAEACAGLSFFVSSLMISSVIAHLGFARLRDQLAIVAASLAVAVIANWVRVYAVVVSGARPTTRGVVDDHLVFGWLIYFAFIAVFTIAVRQYANTAPSAIENAPPVAGPATSVSWMRLAPPAAVAIIAVIADRLRQTIAG